MNLPRVLITGGSGLLGKALMETAPAGLQVMGTFHRTSPALEWRDRFFPLDLKQEMAVHRLWKEWHPNVVIHAASIGSVDEAERNPGAVREVNVEGTKRVGRATLEAGAFFVTLSSNAVFDGLNPPYSESDPVRPANRYGEFKVEAENWVKESFPSFLIVRPILMYGWPFPGGRENVVTRWLDELEKGNPIHVANDVTSMPLLATHCAQTIWAALNLRLKGILHVAGKDRVRLDQFARETARIFESDERQVIPVASSQLNLLAPRPRDTSFLTDRMEVECGIPPLGIREGLTLMRAARTLVS